MTSKVMSGEKTAGTVLLVIGIVALVFSLIFASIFGGIGAFMKVKENQTQEEFEEFQRKGAVQTEGLIVADSQSGDEDGTTVQYEAEGDTYEVSYSLSNSNYRAGQKVTIYYSAQDPSESIFPDLMIDTYNLLYIIFLIIGISLGGLFFLGGIIMLIIGIHLRKKAKREILYQ